MKFCPLSPFSQKMERWIEYLLDPSGLTGLEPAASALTGRCSDQLNYNPREIRCIAYIFLWFHSNNFSPCCNIDASYILIFTWIRILVRATWITSNPFVIAQSIDNQSFNEKKTLFFSLLLLFSLDFILTDPDMNLDY